MKKANLNAVVDALLVITMLCVMFIGILLGFFIGRGDVPQAQKFLWGLHRHDWGDLHLILALILVGLVILHFILHVDWARLTSKRLLRLPWTLSLLILFVIAAAILYGYISFKRMNPGDWEHEERAYRGGRGERRFEEGQGRGPRWRRRFEDEQPLPEGQGPGGRRRGPRTEE